MSSVADYEFSSVTLVDCKPIGRRDFFFSRSANLLFGPNGSGKSSLAHALCFGVWPSGGVVKIRDNGNRDRFSELLKLCLVGEDFFANFFSLGLSKLTGQYPKILHDAAELLGPIGHKGHSVAALKDWLVCGEEGRSPAAPSPLTYMGTGTQCVMKFFFLVAIRKVLNVNCPLIIDDPFPLLDSHHRRLIIGQLEIMDSQVIVFSNPSLRQCFEDKSFDIQEV